MEDPGFIVSQFSKSALMKYFLQTLGFSPDCSGTRGVVRSTFFEVSNDNWLQKLHVECLEGE
jgi:hypothetical protein